MNKDKLTVKQAIEQRLQSYEWSQMVAKKVVLERKKQVHHRYWAIASLAPIAAALVLTVNLVFVKSETQSHQFVKTSPHPVYFEEVGFETADSLFHAEEPIDDLLDQLLLARF